MESRGERAKILNNNIKLMMSSLTLNRIPNFRIVITSLDYYSFFYLLLCLKL